MSKFLGDNDQFIRFLLLACGLLTLAGAVACLLLGNALLAVASCIVSAWSIGYYLDAVWAQMSAARGDEAPKGIPEDQSTESRYRTGGVRER